MIAEDTKHSKIIAAQEDDMDSDSPIYVSYYLENMDMLTSPTLRQKKIKYDDEYYILVNSQSVPSNILESIKNPPVTDESDEEDWEMIEEGKQNSKSTISQSNVPSSFKMEESIYRSVIYSTNTEKPICMSLPKSIPFDDFLNTPNLTKDMIYINEIVEGTMITMFYNVDTERWVLATKNRIGANYFFYRTDYTYLSLMETNQESKYQYTFYEMVMEALGANYTEDINRLPFMNGLPKNCCYHFVLQHPMNHIVFPVVRPNLVLVKVYEIIENIALAIPFSIYQSWECFQSDSPTFFPCSFPKQYLLDPTIDNIYVKLEEIREQYHHRKIEPNQILPQTVDSMGWMIHNIMNGDRSSIRCPEYEYLKGLRGNHSNFHYQYLELEKTRKTVEYLNYFPNYGPLFVSFSQIQYHFITMVHYYYMEYYVRKTKVDIPKKYAPIVFKLHHDVYLPSLNRIEEDGEIARPVRITIEVAMEYIRNMNPAQSFYYLNYDQLQKNHPHGRESV
jgi:hypothetical protein